MTQAQRDQRINVLTRRVHHDVSEVLPEKFGVRVTEYPKGTGNIEVEVGIRVHVSHALSNLTIEASLASDYIQRYGMMLRDELGKELRNILREYYGA